MKEHKLWAITSYFNPAGWNKRRENFRVFRDHLTIPLITVELAHRGRFELAGNDADIVVQLRGGDVMWQKERLLNIALGHLPSTCDQVAWIDCDVVFENTGWAEEASKLLDCHRILQLFDGAYYLSRDAPPGAFDVHSTEASREGFVSAVASGLAPIDCFEHALKNKVGRYAPGLAWAARRSLLEQYHLYDRCILGAGDRALACAIYGCFEHSAEFNHMNRREKDHYLEWAQPFYEDTRNQVGYVAGRLWHLWHGSLKDRRYGTRHADMEPYDFDPLKDIALDDHGLWRWNSGKPAFHQFVEDFFASRKEDG